MLKLSVVLATYNRADTLGRTLEHLARQDLNPSLFEVIVIDDGSPDHTGSVVAKFADTAPYRLVFLRHSNRGPGYTQNRGIREAKAPIVLLMADDIWLAPGALRAHIEVHDQNPQPEIAVLGKVVQAPELNQTAFLRHWDPFGFSDIEGARELPFTMFWACNITAKREFLVCHGLFQERSGPAGHHAHHDTELGYRLHLHGLRILYSATALGHHYHPGTLEQMISYCYERGLNWETFRKLVPAPEALILGRLLTLKTLPEFVRVLRQPNSLPKSERSLFRHIARTVLRNVAFNRLTVPGFWTPFLARAETSPSLERLLNRRIYRALMHYHFVRGIHDGNKQFGA